MSEYDEKVLLGLKKLIRKDEEDRKSKKLKKSRSDFEAIEYRNYFDSGYKKIIDEYVKSILHDYGTFPNPNSSDSLYVDKIQMLDLHEYLSRVLYLPHVVTKVIDHKTHNGGKYIDIGKICNLYTLTVSSPGRFGTNTIKNEFARAFSKLFKWLNDNNILEAFFSKRGIETSLFLYWLIYDNDKKIINLNILVELSEAAKGSFSDFKIYVVGLWLLRRINPSKPIDYISFIKSIHLGSQLQSK
jgi:hypothetical protein